MLGEILGAAGSIAGSLFGKSQADKQAKQQKEFAQKGIQWKVADAKAAGIHPIYALGANTVSYSPTAVGDTGASWGSAGQDIGRAIEAGQSTTERNNGLSARIGELQLEGAKLDNDIKRTQLASNIATLKQPGQPPGSPTTSTSWLLDGQGDTPQLDTPTLKRETKLDVSTGNGAYVAGSTPGTIAFRTPIGGYQVAKAPALAESLEDDATGNWLWQLQARVLAPLMGSEYAPPIATLPWQARYFNPRLLQWEKRDRSEFRNRSFGRFNTRR